MRRFQGGKRALTGACVVGLVASLVMPTIAVASTVPDKNETVYVQTDATGAVTEVTSDVLLSNGDHEESLSDRTRLTDIEPQDEDQSFAASQDGTLVWSTGGKQVSYRGTSDEKPPVEVLVSYQLDGRQVAPEELAGATGHLLMHVDYLNSSSSWRSVAGKERLVSTPFACVTLVSFDTDLVSNVEVTNGSVMEDKGGCVVVGYAVPGLEKSLGDSIDDLDLDLPTYVEIEADVTDFALDPIRTIVTAEPFEDLDASSLEGEGTGDSASALKDAMNQLVSGSGTLTDSLGQLAKGGSALSGGAAALREALGMLPSGLSELKAGASTLSQRLSEASSVAGELSQGATGLSGAATQSLQGIGEAAGSVAQATSSVSTLQDAADGLQLDSVSEDVAAAAGLASDASQVLDGAREALDQAGQGVEAQKTQVKEGLLDARDALGAILSDESLELTDAQREALADQVAAVQDQLDTSLSELEALDVETPQAVLDAQATLAEDAEGLAEHAASIEKARVDVSSLTTLAKDALADLAGASQALERSQGAVAMVAEGSQGMASGLAGMAEGLGAAQAGADALAGGLDAVAAKAPAAVQGIGELQSGIDKLTSGATAVAQGSGTLTSGLATFRDEGVTKVVDALTELDDSLEGVSGSIESISDAAAGYDTFSGKVDGQTGSVRFIYQTESIGK